MRRLDALRADARPRWGRLDASGMLCHLAESARLGLGELRVPSQGSRALRSFPLNTSSCAGGAEHPLFGVLDAREWGALGYKHSDHHLGQFGV